MTDLHTHILPGIDDGSVSVEMSVKMLRMEQEQGIDAVALTPHFYRDLESPESFLRKRHNAYLTLRQALDGLDEPLPKLLLGAEVAWCPGLSAWEEAEELCYDGTRFMLVEPPFQHWTDAFFREMIELRARRNITPVIAHIDRYYKSQHNSSIKALLENGFPVQISASAFLNFWGSGTALRYVREGKAQLVISDCHNVTTRKPNLSEAMEVLRRKFGRDALRLFDRTDSFLF